MQRIMEFLTQNQPHVAPPPPAHPDEERQKQRAVQERQALERELARIRSQALHDVLD